MRGNMHVRFGGRAEGTDQPKCWHRASVRPYSRAVPGHRWTAAEDTLRLEAALRAGLACRGVPKAVLVDRGAAFVNSQFLRACASLGIRLIHARPYSPETKGKIERFLCATRRLVASPA